MTDTVSDLTSLDLYRSMRVIRRMEEEILRLSRDGTAVGSIHLCAGQEAVPVGACAALEPGDRVFATYRGHGWAYAKGVPLAALMAEVCHRAAGVNGGRGGSAHFSAPAYGFMGENSIVGAGTTIACGAAMASVLQSSGRVALVSIGDGAMNQGATHEALAFASARSLPVIFVVENNGWSEMTPIAATVRGDGLTARAASYGIHAEHHDGSDPVRVAELVAEARARCLRGEGPVFLELDVVRLLGHYNGDVEHYRMPAEQEADRDRDPLVALRARLVADGTSPAEVETVDREVDVLVAATSAEVVALPSPDPSTAGEHLYSPATAPVVDPDLGVRQITFAQAVNEALRTELAQRPETLVYGEDVAIPGGVFGATRGLRKQFGPDRVFDTPIAENAILGSAIGAAMEGLRPIVEIMWGDFLLVALDQLVNQAANVSYVSRGELSAPMVVRLQQGATPGSCAQHSQSLEALLAHVPGLRVGLPATPQDAYSMLRAAVADPDPCVIIEARGLYKESAEIRLGGPGESVGGARVRREGRHYGLITWGTALPLALAAAAELAGEGLEVGVLDLRWLNPLDHAAIGAFVRASGGRIAIVHEANLTGGFGAEIAARLADEHFFELDAPIARIGADDTRLPAAPALQQAVIPTVSSIVARLRTCVAHHGDVFS